MAELREWRQRHEYRFMKLNKAKKMELFSWLDNLAYEEASAEEAEEVVREWSDICFRFYYASATEGGAGGIMFSGCPSVHPAFSLSRYLKNYLRYELQT